MFEGLAYFKRFYYNTFYRIIMLSHNCSNLLFLQILIVELIQGVILTITYDYHTKNHSMKAMLSFSEPHLA